MKEKLSISIPTDLYHQLRAAAQIEHRSVSGMASILVRDGLAVRLGASKQSTAGDPPIALYQR